MSQYRVIAHKHPEAVAGVGRSGAGVAPALVADDQGRLAMVHEGSRDFNAMEPEAQRSHVESVLNEKHKWRRYGTGGQLDWKPGGLVKVSPDGSSFVDYGHGGPGEGMKGGAALAENQDDAPPGLQDAAQPESTPGQDDGPMSGERPDAGKCNTAPRQTGTIETLTGHASNQGEPFDYAVPLTTCKTCVNFQIALTNVGKPCRRPASEIAPGDFQFYQIHGGCPFYSFGSNYAPAEDQGQPASTPDGADADAEDSQAVQNSLWQQLGAKVDGPVAQGVKLDGEPTHSPGLISHEDARQQNGDGDDGDAPPSVGEPDAEEGGQPDSAKAGKDDDSVSFSEEGDSSMRDAAGKAEWFDGCRAERPNGSPDVEDALEHTDSISLKDRDDVIAKIHAEHVTNGGRFDEAVRKHKEHIMALPKEEANAD